MRGDWETAESLIELDENIVTARISIFSWTALHIASGQGPVKFVEQLVRRMTKEALALQDLGGYTALHYAAKAGSLRCVQAIHRKNPRLTQISCNSGHVPLHMAAGSSTTPGQKEVVRYLCEVTESEGPHGPFASSRGFELMWGVIGAEYLVVPVKLEGISPEAHMHNPEQCDGDAMPFFSKLRVWVNQVPRLIIRVPALKRIYEEKSKHKQALELLNHIFLRATELDNSAKLHLLTSYNILDNAAAKGIVEILKACFEFFPDAVWFTTNYESLSRTCIKN